MKDNDVEDTVELSSRDDAISKLLEELGMSQYLDSTQCNLEGGIYVSQVDSWAMCKYM